MKKILSALIAIAFMLSATIAIAETTIQTGSGNVVLGVDEYTAVENTLDIRPHAASVVEKLGEYGKESGDRNAFILINLDICNISFDEIDLNNIFSAELTYADKYVFSPEVTAEMSAGIEDTLVGKWEGTYRTEPTRRTCSFEITEITSDGEFKGVWSFGPLDDKDTLEGSYTVTGVINSDIGSITFGGKEWIVQPEHYVVLRDFYLKLVDNHTLCGAVTSVPIFLSKSEAPNSDYTLKMLEEIEGYPLVFLVPNRVASDIENCKVDVIINGNHYQISLK